MGFPRKRQIALEYHPDRPPTEAAKIKEEGSSDILHSRGAETDKSITDKPAHFEWEQVITF